MPGANFLCFATALLLLILILIADARYPVLRDMKTDGTGQGRGSFSLGRVQMAFWTVLIVAALVKLAAANCWVIADKAIDVKLLALMGISGVTGLAALTVDVQKDKSAADAAARLDAASSAAAEIKSSLAQLQSAAAPVPDAAAAISKLQEELATRELERNQAVTEISRTTRKAAAEGFFKDILEDENGNSLHRLQMVFFTLLTGLLFAVQTLALVGPAAHLPTVSEEMLGLMGISNSLYVGFKIPGKSS